MKVKNPIKKQTIIMFLLIVVFFSMGAVITFLIASLNFNRELAAQAQKETIQTQKMASLSSELKQVTSQDQYVKNKKLEEEIKNIQNTFKKSLSSYERILDLKQSKKTDTLDEQFAKTLLYLSEKNYSSGTALLVSLDEQLKKETFTQSSAILENVAVNNTPPTSGYSNQKVNTDAGSFVVNIVSGDLNSTKVIVDTASDSNCNDNCPVLSLGDYATRNGAYAGINGSYFCPASYPSCTGKTNSFDLLVMNKNKTYFNSDNNVYSTNPVVAFLNDSVRFMGRGSDWGRDTGGSGVLMNYPLLVSGGQITFGGDSDPKHNNKGGRSFVANKGNIVYIGVVFNATVAESAKTLQALGMDNALNLDDGGSTALWFQGYKAGPGRNIPNAILFVRK